MTGSEVVKILIKNGWKIDRIKGSHYIMKKKDKTISVPVHGKKDVPIGTLNNILKEAELK